MLLLESVQQDQNVSQLVVPKSFSLICLGHIMMTLSWSAWLIFIFKFLAYLYVI